MTTAMPDLLTERLRIRPFRPDDLPAAHRILDLETKMGEYSLEQRAEFLRWADLNHRQLAALYQPPYGDRAIVLRDSGELVGSIGVVPMLLPFGLLPVFAQEVYPGQEQLSWPEIGLFWAVSSAHHGRGIATEAGRAVIDYLFSAVRVRRLVSTTEFDNLASQRVMVKLGMSLHRNPHPEPPYLQVAGLRINPG
jgi:RimJ/RimL family protein N-acetyltransferase